MNKRQLLLACVVSIITTASYAEISKTISLTTDYVFRGISNTSGDPAIQGSFDYSHDSGAYAGLWASNVKFRENAGEAAVDAVDEASIEIDYYAGFSGDISDALSWDAGLNYMTYPGAESSLNYDYLEAYGLFAYAVEDAPLSPELGLELYHSNNYFERSGPANYIAATVALTLPHDSTLSIRTGKSTFDDSPADDYSDYSIGISTEIDSYELKLDYSGTDISRLNCGDNTCDSRLVFSLTSSM